MIIQSERTGKSALVMSLSGRLDTATAPQLERKIKQWGEEITELTLDFLDLTYISSMGLRVLLQTQKTMNAQGRKLIIRNMNESIREVFEMTGFINLLVQEEKFVVIRKDDKNQIVLSLNGQMDNDNVPMVQKELEQLKQANRLNEEETTVILDVEKLTCLSTGGSKLLKAAIADTAWEKRKLSIQHASKDTMPIFQTEGMGHLLEG